MTSSVTSAPRSAGRQCMYSASDFASDIRRASQIQSSYRAASARAAFSSVNRSSRPQDFGYTTSASRKASSISSIVVMAPPPAAAASSARLRTSGMRSNPGGWANTTLIPNRGRSVSRPCGTESGFAYEGANAHDTATRSPWRSPPRCSRKVIRSARVWVGWSTSHWRLITGMSAHFATSRMYAFPSYGTRSWRMAVPRQDDPHVLRALPVSDLGLLGVQEVRVPTELGHPCLERVPRASGLVQEQHEQRPVGQEPMGLASVKLLLQLRGKSERLVDLLGRPVQGLDVVATSKRGAAGHLRPSPDGLMSACTSSWPKNVGIGSGPGTSGGGGGSPVVTGGTRPTRLSGRTGTRFSSRPVASRRADTMAAVATIA